MEQTIFLSLANPRGLANKLERQSGILDIVTGYVNGHLAFPKKEQVESGLSGHAYAIKVVYDDEMVSLNSVLESFLNTIDLTESQKSENPRRNGLYYTDMLQGVDANIYFTSVLNSPYPIKIAQMNNFYPAMF